MVRAKYEKLTYDQIRLAKPIHQYDFRLYLFKTNYKSASLALGLTYGLPNYTAYTGYAESHCANHINADAL